MIDELNIPIEQLLPLVIVLSIVNICLWLHLGSYQLDIQPKGEREGKDTKKLTNVTYGAYIQSQSRYYN